jgi:predicted RNase H-like HicB family nuclease
MQVRVIYHREDAGWWADSPDLEGWTVAGASYERVRRLVDDGLLFALECAADDRGELLDKSAISVDHSVAG